MKTSIGTEVKNAPNASNEIPPKVSIIPLMIVRMAIIVTPIGRFICSAKSNNDLFDNSLNKKNLENLELYLLLFYDDVAINTTKILLR
jgi:hypothetical protein